MSVQYNILAGVKAALVTLNLTGVGSNVKLRKRLSYFKSFDTLPMVQVVPGGPKRPVQQTFEEGIWYDYPVLVAYIVETGYTPEEGLEAHLDIYEAIENHLFYIPATGVTGVSDVAYNPSPAWDVSELPKGFDISLQMFTYRKHNTRRTS